VNGAAGVAAARSASPVGFRAVFFFAGFLTALASYYFFFLPFLAFFFAMDVSIKS